MVGSALVDRQMVADGQEPAALVRADGHRIVVSSDVRLIEYQRSCMRTIKEVAGRNEAQYTAAVAAGRVATPGECN